MYDDYSHKIIIVGAGAAGIGFGVFLEKSGFKDYIILEKDDIGSSFKKWPEYTRFISPSFTGNFFNAVDLNAITPDTSPGYTLRTEHPTGKQYAEYLEKTATHFSVNIATNTLVKDINKHDDIFTVTTSRGTYTSQFVIWAGGEFQYSESSSITGIQHCVHSSQVKTMVDEDVVIVGGFESGMELAIKLLEEGKKVIIIDKKEPWTVTVSDSSISLAPYTLDRLRPYIGTDALTLIGNVFVTHIAQEDGGYIIYTEKSGNIKTQSKPILATGFQNLPPVVEKFFTENNKGYVALTDNDESTITPNIFLIGPKVQHGDAIFCFIYKFRQRLPIVAETIAKRLGISFRATEEYQDAHMYLKDLSCCTDECTC